MITGYGMLRAMRMALGGAALGALFSLTAFLGCTQPTPPQQAKEDPSAVEAKPVAAEESAAPKTETAAKTGGQAIPVSEVRLVVGDAKALDALIASHKGEVVFVDYWATWCGPCVEFFPQTVALADKFRERGLATISVSFDAADEPQIPREFLAGQGARFENLLSSHELGPAAFQDFKLDAVPHFRLYDRQGKLRHQWDAHPEGLEAKVEELLAEKAS